MKNLGVLDRTYYQKRKNKRSFIYRLNRRTHEVIQAIKQHYLEKPSIIIDLGTADGLMLGKIKEAFSFAQCVGIELSEELLKSNPDKNITLLQGDVNYLPISDNRSDIVIATAVIEHLQNPKRFLQETIRVLRPDGLLILTSPDPFWEKIATMVGHLQKDTHLHVMRLPQLKRLFEEVGYTVIEQKKFMLSPIGVPFELSIENLIRNIGLDILFANQLVIGKKVV